MDLTPARIEKAAAIAEIDEAELTLRMLEANGDFQVIRDQPADVILARLTARNRDIAHAIDGMRRSARAAMLYWRECIAASRRPS